jgi:ribonuclease VapC
VSAAGRRSRRGFVLDSHALLAYFEGEPSGEVVRDLLEAAERRRASLYLSLINWGEVSYIVAREKGTAAAREVLARIDAMPVRLRGVDRALVEMAAGLKAGHAIAYADAFAAATAIQLGVAVVTGDPEFRALREHVEVVWTR